MPETRPSKKIAKLFPQTDPLKNQKDQKDGAKAAETSAAGPAAGTNDAAKTARNASTGSAGGAASGGAARDRTEPSCAASSHSPPLPHRAMKRPSPPMPESIIAPRRKRALSEEERALWESVAKQVKPLRKKTSRGEDADRAPLKSCRPRAKSAGLPKSAAISRSAKIPEAGQAAAIGATWAAANARNCRAAGKKSKPGSICTA